MKWFTSLMLALLVSASGQNIELTTSTPGTLGLGGSFDIKIGQDHYYTFGGGVILPFAGDKPQGAEVSKVSPYWIVSGTAISPKYVLYIKSGALFYGKFYTGLIIDTQYDRKAIEYNALGGNKFYSVETNRWLPYFGGEIGYKFANILTTVNYSYARGIGLTLSVAP